MNRPFIIAVIALGITGVWLPSSTLAQVQIPPGQACKSNGQNEMRFCRIRVFFKDGQWTTEPVVYFGQPHNVHIVWMIVGNGPHGSQWHFENDSLWLPANADVKDFKDPCATEDEDKCSTGAPNPRRFHWFVDYTHKTEFDYELKLYPNTDSKRPPVVVKVFNPDKTKGPARIDPTVVIQG